MPADPEILQHLSAVIALLGRLQFPEEELRKIILPGRATTKYIEAYNLCDGTRTRIEVSKAVRLDKDDFNKAVKRWIQAGVLFDIGTGKSTRLLHLYPFTLEAKPVADRSSPKD